MGAERRRPGSALRGGPGLWALKADVSRAQTPYHPGVEGSGRESLRTAGPDSVNPDPKAAGRRREHPDSPGPPGLAPPPAHRVLPAAQQSKQQPQLTVGTVLSALHTRVVYIHGHAGP